MSNKAKCDECGRMSEIEHRKKKLRNKVDMHYFKCNHCNHIYLICYMDETIRRKTKKIRRLNRLKYKTKEQDKQIEALNQEIKLEMDALAKELSMS